MEFTDNVTPSFSDYLGSKYPTGAYPNGLSMDKRLDAFDSWAQMYFPNAFQAALLNYQNEYEKPVNQMLRYQEAGLNPYSYQHSQSASGSSGAAPTPQFGNQELTQKKIQNVLSGVSSLSGAFSVAKDLYDYINYGRERSGYQTTIAKYNSEAAQQIAEQQFNKRLWSDYWDMGVDAPITTDSNGNVIQRVSDSPRAKYMKNSTDRISRQVKQLDYMVDFLYPSQVEQNKAKAALAAYQKAVMEGHNDAILNINTGNKTADAILRFLSYLLTDNIGMFF